MRAGAADAIAVTAGAAAVAALVAAPVLRAPSERLFGMAIVGRHHDPFTVMQQFDRPFVLTLYTQPVTDGMGALLATLTGPVAAYTWLVLITFPLSAAAAWLLARHLSLSRSAAAFAALAYAFAPFHLAQAAYHPHIAQTQWVPLYFLALFRSLDGASPAAAALLVAATLAVTLSNFYGGLIVAVLTPVAVVAYWAACARTRDRPCRNLAATLGVLLLMAGSGLAYVWYAAPGVVADPGAFAFPQADLFRYSARWWSYLLPPVEHPLLGATAARVWASAGVGEGLLEQQVSLGWGIVALALVAVAGWWRGNGAWASRAAVPALAVIAVTALVCSLSPERTVWGVRFIRPSGLLHDVVPMFRAYARFGVVVQLMAVLLAGIGIDHLRRRGTGRWTVACVALVGLTVGEYMVWPPAMWRDVLPTTAHRWVTRQPGPLRVLDCVPPGAESASIPWLTAGLIATLPRPDDDCLRPDLPGWLAAERFTHVLVRNAIGDDRGFAVGAAPDGLRMAARLADGAVFAVTAVPPAIYVSALTGFHPRERDGDRSWRWMDAAPSWAVVNTRDAAVAAILDVELWAVDRSRHVVLRLDGRPIATLPVEPRRQYHTVGPVIIPPGRHMLAFAPIEPPAIADDVLGNGDRRALSCALGEWHWRPVEVHP